MRVGPPHGAKASGMGTAFVGVADDPSSILHNPGGLTQTKGTNVYQGSTGVTILSQFKNKTGSQEKTKFELYFPPHLFLSSHLGKSSIAIGLGLYSPFGVGGRKWNKEGITRYASTENIIGTYSINPTVAWQALPNVSVAAGVDYLRAMSEAEKMVNQSLFGAGDGELHMKTDGDGWGYNVGLLFKPFKTFHFGFAYRSEITVASTGRITLLNIAPALQSSFGGASYSTIVSTKSTFPEIYSTGLAYEITKRWLLAVDAELVRWSSFDTVNLDIEAEVPSGAFVDSSTPIDWEDSWQLKLGGQYRASDSFFLRAGYAYIMSAVPAHTITAGNPDANQHNVSVGFGYAGKKITVDAFYLLDIFETRKVDNDTHTGEFKTTAHFFGFSLGYRFGDVKK